MQFQELKNMFPSTCYLTNQQQLRILKDAHAGNYTILEVIKQKYPHYHWTELKYKQTGDTILHCIARLGHVDLIKYLLTEYQPSAVDCKNKDNKTPLHDAAQFSQFETVKLLLEHGAEVNTLKRGDWTPLMLACTKSGNANYKIVELLLRNGGIVNYPNRDGWTALHLISREGDTNILNLLINYQINLNAITKNKRTALHIASLHGHYNFVQILLDLGLNPNTKDSCGNTPLHEAVLGRNVNVCDLLLRYGAEQTCKNNVDVNLLHLAASEGCCEMIQYILYKLRFDVNARTINGFTALHCAAKRGQLEAYKILSGLGADVNVKDNFNKLPLDYM